MAKHRVVCTFEIPTRQVLYRIVSNNEFLYLQTGREDLIGDLVWESVNVDSEFGRINFQSMPFFGDTWHDLAVRHPHCGSTVSSVGHPDIPKANQGALGYIRSNTHVVSTFFILQETYALDLSEPREALLRLGQDKGTESEDDARKKSQVRLGILTVLALHLQKKGET